jgi:error-prone DNA polymerase
MRWACLKIDVLGLGMLTCIRKALELINRRRARADAPPLDLAGIPAEDPGVYDMICEADTVGVFQIESRAQMSMLPRLKPRCFYDLVIEVAIVRPGPIQGNMIHPYLKRRSGLEKTVFPDERVRRVLGKTLGIPLFQEQAMRLSIELAGFSPGEAEQLRRAMAAWRKNESIIAAFQERIVSGIVKNGYSRAFAESCVQQIKGFSEYGFPESHAASFALLVYASAWIKKYHPAEFAAALVNSQPMGFYRPAQIIADAKRHGVTAKPADVNLSQWDCTLEDLPGANPSSAPQLRLGMRLVKHLGKDQAEAITAAVRKRNGVRSVSELWQTVKTAAPSLPASALYALADADAFRSLGLNRRRAIWEIKALPPLPAPLDGAYRDEPVNLPRSQKSKPSFRTTLQPGFPSKPIRYHSCAPNFANFRFIPPPRSGSSPSPLKPPCQWRA